MAVPYGLAATIATSLVGGGPVTMIWGWILVSCLSLPLAFSLGEIYSKYPTSAGVYYWCFRLAPPKYRLLFSWINGWLTVVGVWTVSLSVTFGTAQLLVAGLNVFWRNWVATAWQTYLNFFGVALVTSIVGILFNGILPTIDVLSACWTMLGLIVMMVCLTMKAASGRHSASFVFGHFDPSNSGWSPGWTFFIGLLPPGTKRLVSSYNYDVPSFAGYTFSSIGLITSMAEEVRNPSIEVPKVMVWSIPIGGLCGMLFLLPIVFTLPDIPTLLAVGGAQPIGYMLEMVMGSKSGAFGLWLIIFGVGIFCSISCCCAASRATWAFARDKAVPFHQSFARISSRLADVPLNAYLLSTAIQLLLGLIYLGSSTAFNAFAGVAVICLGASYALPVAISLAHNRKDMTNAPYFLGRWGHFLNVMAVLWTLFQIVLFSMPVVIPVSTATMNYAPVVFVGFSIVSTVWYLIDGRFHYSGPPLPNQAMELDIRGL